jgi:DNA invertase Pin-like site-specific DNA recombinase
VDTYPKQPIPPLVNTATKGHKGTLTEQASGTLNLHNQEKRCRDYCTQKSLTVAEVFLDARESARSADRPYFQRMIAFCKSHRRLVGYVVTLFRTLEQMSRKNLRLASPTGFEPVLPP